MKCCVCGKEIKGYGNSPSPLNGSKCCDECNLNVVVPLRIFLRGLEKQEYALLVKEKRAPWGDYSLAFSLRHLNSKH